MTNIAKLLFLLINLKSLKSIYSLIENNKSNNFAISMLWIIDKHL